ncbi:MAG: response regulator [Lachnospiraceae bacterium]|nr:response regulator [Lachnospiraceae bacterium]
MDNTLYGNQTANILIVDDTTSNLMILAEMIKSIGYIARPVTSVKQAMSAIAIKKPQLILLDISMPEIDGFDFCEMLKQDITLKDIPIIFISALNSTEDKVKGFKLGAVDFISKPFELEEITLRINTHLKIFRMQNELKVHNKRLFKMFNDQVKQVTKEQETIAYTLAKLLEIRNDKNGEHIDNVGRFCKILSMGLQLSPKYEKQITASFIDSIVFASPFHDAGMAYIRDSIVLKRGPLEPEERKCMEEHTIKGAKILYETLGDTSNENIKMAIDIAKYHHERWDGAGYPCGLSGEDIPLAARILSVADVYDILTSERCYRKAYSHEESIKIIEEEAGKQFDPEIVKVFLKIQNQFRKEENR